MSSSTKILFLIFSTFILFQLIKCTGITEKCDNGNNKCYKPLNCKRTLIEGNYQFVCSKEKCNGNIGGKCDPKGGYCYPFDCEGNGKFCKTGGASCSNGGECCSKRCSKNNKIISRVAEEGTCGN
ncbi:hypothetical protein ACQ4LE_010563 [Meloidogyne hapla]